MANKPSLAETHPEIAREWHPTLNGDLTPRDFTHGSDIKPWWKCDIGEDHEWQAIIYSRTKGRGCPVCRGFKVVLSNCLSTTHPEVAKQWHPTKNKDLTPYDVGIGSTKKIWWKCDKGDDHEWSTTPNNRAKGTGCPVCSNQKVVLSNCLSTTHPEIAKQWHPTKNKDLTPYDVGIGSSKRIWWKCDKGDDHEWSTKQRKYKGRIKQCPFCSGHKTSLSTSLAKLRPDLIKEWHPTKNKNINPLEISLFSHKKIWWKCDKADDHEWLAHINNRTSQGNGCPFCKNRKISQTNSVINTHPFLVKEFHKEKNGKIILSNYVAGSTKQIQWKCDKGEDHEWKTSIKKRTFGRNCPFCTLTPQSRQELIITFELSKIFKNINPKGYKTRLDRRLRAIDIFIPELNLAIEFDGSYWHKNKRAIDKIKSEMLLKKGYKVIRVRQEPLKKIYETDIISKNPYNGKQATNDLLSVILSMYDLGDKKVSRIKEYQAKDGLQNEKDLDRYIDNILTEKASKSSN